ncbi:MAG: T9SS type A sorting domain-containing protein, partial [Sediminibacterium sp.]|nr:T9SS type A sorting domain-containing protein [Sediminibacterium sp.]
NRKNNLNALSFFNFPVLQLEKSIDNGLVIYPNPANNIISVQFGGSNISDIIISDLSGRLVYVEKLNESVCKINTKTFTNGYYLIMVRTENGNLYREKLVVLKNE